jgi:pimeloyl-ACP methyl ester carboxylesterase
MMMLAGGPGQASALAFDLPDLGDEWRSMFPGYTLVAFDPRGTGNSGFLGCTIDAAAFVSEAQVTACGNTLGPSRAFYTTAANAEDVDAVRQALGVDKVGLWGTSYGTKVELAYALGFPTHVERLLLDSVVPTTGPDPYGLETLQNIPNALRALCGTAACRKITTDLPGQVVTLANRAAAKPITGRIRDATGRLVRESLDGPTLLAMVVSTDLDPGLQAELPSAIASAAAGRPQALLRIESFAQAGLRIHGYATADTSFSEGLFLATMCGDGRFPWQPNDDLQTRQQALSAALAALPAGSTGPFGSWATQIGPANYCLFWPTPNGNAPLAAGPLPDVPVLALSGGIDMRTPTPNALSVVSQFPQGHVVVVPGVGHSVLTVDPSGCAVNAVKLWLNGGTPAARCKAARPYLQQVPKIPASVAAAPPSHGATGLRGRTLTATVTTVQDALAAGLTASRPIGGLSGGRASADFEALVLTRYSDVPGLTVSGTLKVDGEKTGALLGVSGEVTVAGPKAAKGVVTFAGTRVTVRWAR